MKYYKICFEAIKNNGGAIIFVPKNLIDKKICLKAIRNNLILQFIPNNKINKEVFLKFKKEFKYSLNYTVKNTETNFSFLDTIFDTIMQHNIDLQFFPKKIKEVALAFINNDDGYLKYIPKEYKNII